MDGRADVYSLGCVLYRCLAGEVPFPRDTEVATIYAHVQDPPPVPSERFPELGVGFDAPIARALAKSPEDRFERAAIRRCCGSRRPPSPSVACAGSSRRSRRRRSRRGWRSCRAGWRVVASRTRDRRAPALPPRRRSERLRLRRRHPPGPGAGARRGPPSTPGSLVPRINDRRRRRHGRDDRRRGARRCRRRTERGGVDVVGRCPVDALGHLPERSASSGWMPSRRSVTISWPWDRSRSEGTSTPRCGGRAIEERAGTGWRVPPAGCTKRAIRRWRSSSRPRPASWQRGSTRPRGRSRRVGVDVEGRFQLDTTDAGVLTGPGDQQIFGATTMDDQR